MKVNSRVITFLTGTAMLMILMTGMAQVSISTDGSAPDNSAILDIKSVTKGLLIPRMQLGQIAEILNPANGMLVFCTTNDKIYVYISNGNSWKELSFGSGTITPWSCGFSFVDFRDSTSYNTVQIGTQCWMSQNLNFGTMIPGTSEQTNNGIFEKYCYINNEAYCTMYGGLYQWNEAMQYVQTNGAGICPSGWHIPADAEFTILADYLGGHSIAGGKMKEAGVLNWLPPNTGATNESGFTGLPAGRRKNTAAFEYLNWYNYNWSSTSNNDTTAWVLNLTYYYQSADRSSDYSKSNGFTVRCLRDQ